ncbi:MAG: rhodanese-like domain-containing protein [Anaerolineae bacterium]|nr:rhodanese-like domain-containing protein [Anaerolineae bacterium]
MRKITGLWIVLLLMLVSCTPAKPSETSAVIVEATAASLGPDVSVDDVAALVPDGSVTVIDVREKSEFDEGHIAGATLVPLGELASRVDEIPTDRPVILVCRSGNRSGQAYRLLGEKGFTNIHNMTGGMLAWQKAGHPVEK